jgi:hypothetical protein
MKKIITGLFLISQFLFSGKGNAQEFTSKNSGVRLGLVIGLGNRMDRIGVTCNAYYFDNFFQLNAEIRAYYNFRNPGPKKMHPELVSALGFVFGYGKNALDSNQFITSISNQMNYRNSFAYSYNFYLNKIKTTQQTGIVALQFQNFSVAVENDILARPRFDRFRTGAFLLQYQYKQFQFAINTTLWTGQMGNVVHDNNPHFPHGYVDATNAVYPEFSSGLLSAQFKTVLPFFQYAQANIGIDAEQVRNVMQNRFIHGVFRSKNSDIPMLDTNGMQYLYKDGQEIRKANFYYNTFLNPGIFY